MSRTAFEVHAIVQGKGDSGQCKMETLTKVWRLRSQIAKWLVMIVRLFAHLLIQPLRAMWSCVPLNISGSQNWGQLLHTLHRAPKYANNTNSINLSYYYYSPFIFQKISSPGGTVTKVEINPPEFLLEEYHCSSWYSGGQRCNKHALACFLSSPLMLIWGYFLHSFVGWGPHFVLPKRKYRFAVLPSDI